MIDRPIRLSEAQSRAAEEAILAQSGGTLLRFMRDTFFHQPANDRDLSIPQARDLQWITTDAEGNPRLTPLGWMIADSAREYCNWIVDQRGIPFGLSETDVAGRRVLDIGCGWGRHVLSMRSAGALATGVDCTEVYLQLSSILARRENLDPPDIIRAKGECLPFRDSCFDFVMMASSLGCMNIRVVLCEVGRVLVPGGTLIANYMSFGEMVSDRLSKIRHEKQLSSVIRLSWAMANSLCYRWFDRRLRRRNAGAAASSVALTRRFMENALTNAGMEHASWTGETLISHRATS